MLFFSACNSPSNNNEGVLEIIANHSSDIHIDSVQWVAVLSESGCIGCNQSFAKVLEGHINQENGVILFTGSGGIIDISKFLEYDNENFLFLNQSEIPEGIKGKSSSMVFMKDQHIDTCINISSDNLKDQLMYIHERL
jgi:hypothetical protein